VASARAWAPSGTISPGLLGDGDELRRRDRRTPDEPAHECLETDRLAGLEVDDGLVEHGRLVAVDRPAQGLFHAVPPAHRRPHRLGKHRDPVATALLGSVHGRIRVPQQLLGRDVPGRLRIGDAHR